MDYEVESFVPAIPSVFLWWFFVLRNGICGKDNFACWLDSRRHKKTHKFACV
jgi:hypothetical protein